MAEAPMNAELSVCVFDLVYRTRGQHWDYVFLLQPPPLVSEGWYGVHRRVFGGVEPSAEPRLLSGSFGASGDLPFVATAFTDAERRDAQGRSIVHYLLWLRQTARPGLRDFGFALRRALGPALDSVFDLDPARFSPRVTAFDTQLAAVFRAAIPEPEFALPLAPGSSAPFTDLGRLPL